MINLQTIRNLALSRADMSNSNFRDDQTLNYLINTSIEELYDLIVAKYEDYFIKEINFNLTSNDDGYLIPDQVYKLKGLDFKISSDYVNVHPFNFEERNLRNITRQYYGVYNIRYRMLGNKLIITPKDEQAGEYRMWYIPRFADLVNDNDTLQVDLEQYVDYVIVDVAIKLLQQEESDPSVLIMQKEALKQRIKNMTSNRDAAYPGRITDVNTYWYDDLLPTRY